MKLTSNTTEVYNISELVKSPTDYYFLSLQSLVYYITISYKEESYDQDLYEFDEENQTLTFGPSLNDWVTFSSSNS